jgi:CheY-like chemotaxis protein
MSTDSTQVPNVLVVEDEMILRMRAVDLVEDAGFCPIEAVNADEAMSILESRSDISLLFTDYSNARRHGRPEARPRGARTLALNQDHIGFRSSKAI